MTTTLAARTVVERYLLEVLGGTGPATADELVANAGLRQRVAAFRVAFPDLSIVPHLLLASDDFVAVHASGRGTHRGVFQGVPASGRTWTASCTALYRVENGRICDYWINWDLLAILEQLGAVDRRAPASA